MLPFLFLLCWLLGRALLFYFAFGHSLSMYLFLALHLGCSCLRLLSHWTGGTGGLSYLAWYRVIVDIN